ncbi:uncharacterized protein [Chelonus insularis]|uniref:uncharacterized protein n=1 Tax=Chelonus insularis TaxID=460826 RepID=UPI00158BC536|nr:uncharacterized protein LOC118071081 [Chelonus insularis]
MWQIGTTPSGQKNSELKTGNIVGVTPKHEHASDIAAVEMKMIKAKIAKKARTNDSKPATVITQALRGVLSPVSALLPKLSSMSRTVNRIRAKENPQLPDVSSRCELVLTEEFKYTHTGELFLLYDNGGSKRRFLMFTTHKNLNVLSRCQQWLGDGTFRVAPNNFSQLYTIIHGFMEGRSVPLVYVLLPNKLKNTYIQVLKVLRRSLPNFSPSVIMVDFETAFIEALKEVYAGVKVAGCNFHFNQCYWRRIQACGLQARYNTDVLFAYNLRLLSALAFIPPDHVTAGYEAIVECDFYDNNK